MEIKQDYSSTERETMAQNGTAMPDGSYPIGNENDLKNAISAFGRSKNPEKTKLHIIKRATDLKLEELIPQQWTQPTKLKKKSQGEPMSYEADSKGMYTGMGPDDDEEMEPMVPATDDTSKKAVVTVDAEGGVVKCAKGADAGDCGYKAGSKVCGKCGAMAVEAKGVPTMDDENPVEDDAEDGMEEDEKGIFSMMRRRKRGRGYKKDALGDDEEQIIEPEVARLDVNSPDERNFLRQYWLSETGVKSLEIEDGAFACMTEQKVLPGGTAPCADCTGGCVSTDGYPDLAEIEAVAGALFGKVLDSGYSDTADRFLVSIERPEGFFEAHFDGAGEFKALIRMPDDMLIDDDLLTADEAITSALAHVSGKALYIDAAIYDGGEVYAVEIEGTDGKSHDVYVDPISGDVCGIDSYDLIEGVEAKGADADFLASIMEFQMLEMESDINTDTPEA